VTYPTPWSRVLHEKLIVAQLLRMWPSFYGSQRFIAMFMKTGAGKCNTVAPDALFIIIFTTASRTALEPSQPPIQWVLGALSLGDKAAGG